MMNYWPNCCDFVAQLKPYLWHYDFDGCVEDEEQNRVIKVSDGCPQVLLR